MLLNDQCTASVLHAVLADTDLLLGHGALLHRNLLPADLGPDPSRSAGSRSTVTYSRRIEASNFSRSVRSRFLTLTVPARSSSS